MIPLRTAMKKASVATDANVTDLLRKWNAGDPEALDKAIPLVYDELHRIAEVYFRRERAGHTLQATALVHEACLRLIEGDGIEWQNRSQFVGVVARVMRRVLVDHARRRARSKRGGRVQRVTLAEAAELPAETSPDLLALDDALEDLKKIDRQKAGVVELRFFGGMSIDEIARCLGISASTVNREWARAKIWLYRRLKKGAEAP